MKEQIHTIPINDAFLTGDECPFCYIERMLEEHTLDFTLSSRTASYMESDIRSQTDAAGFCRTHYKKMYDYGNRLGMGLIMKTHFRKLTQEMNEQMDRYKPSHTSFFDKLKKGKGSDDSRSELAKWTVSKEDSCYICNFYKQTYQRYLETFFDQYKKDPQLREIFANSKGLCIPHFGDLVESSERCLSDKEKQEFLDVLFPLMKSNMQRLCDDLDWFCDKFDYRFKDADWKTSKDALPRGMQKAAGGYPALPPHTAER